jgi:hypothetical protein
MPCQPSLVASLVQLMQHLPHQQSSKERAMSKLDKFETRIVVGTVWGTAVLSALMSHPNGIRAFTDLTSGPVWSVWSFVLGYAAVGILNKHRQAKQSKPTADGSSLGL